jgi:hypothetical protein
MRGPLTFKPNPGRKQSYTVWHGDKLLGTVRYCAAWGFTGAGWQAIPDGSTEPIGFSDAAGKTWPRVFGTRHTAAMVLAGNVLGITSQKANI